MGEILEFVVAGFRRIPASLQKETGKAARLLWRLLKALGSFRLSLNCEGPQLFVLSRLLSENRSHFVRKRSRPAAQKKRQLGGWRFGIFCWCLSTRRLVRRRAQFLSGLSTGPAGFLGSLTCCVASVTRSFLGQFEGFQIFLGS